MSTASNKCSKTKANKKFSKTHYFHVFFFLKGSIGKITPSDTIADSLNWGSSI